MVTIRKNTSIVWNYFTLTVAEDDKLALCNICCHSLKYAHSTTNMREHLKRKHPEVSLEGTYKKDVLYKEAPPPEIDSQDVNPFGEYQVEMVVGGDEEEDAAAAEAGGSRKRAYEEAVDADLLVPRTKKGAPRQSRKRSYLWKYFTDSPGQFQARCNFCERMIVYKSTISNLKKHLEVRHPHRVDPDEDSDEESDGEADADAGGSDEEWTPGGGPRAGGAGAASAPSTRRSSVVWAHFRRVGGQMAACVHCQRQLSHRTTTSNLAKHLQRMHPGLGIGLDIKLEAEEDDRKDMTPEELAAIQEQLDIQSEKISQSLGQPPAPHKNKVKLTLYTPKKYVANEKKVFIENAILQLFISDFQPFSIVTDKGFRGLLNACFPAFVIPNQSYFSDSLLPSLYKSNRVNAQNKMQSAKTMCLTTDVWNSVADDTFMAVTAHFISADYAFKTMLLECVPLLGGLDSATVARELQRVAGEWDLKEKVLMVVTDGEPNVKKAILDSLGWRHFECYAHTLNEIIEESLEHVRQFLERVRTIVAYFVTSPTATHTLLIIQQELEVANPLNLIQDIPTRWITTYAMLKRFLEMQEAISHALKDTDLSPLSAVDLESCVAICDILKPFEEVCKAMSLNQIVTASQVIPMSRGLKIAVKRLLHKEVYNNPVSEVLRKLQAGLNEKIPNLEQDDIFAMCMFLDPRFKHYYESEEAASNTKQIVIALVTSIIVEREEQSAVADTSERRNTSSGQDSSIWEEFDKLTNNIVKPADALNTLASLEVEQYMREDVLPREKSPLDWWRIHDHLYPNLSQLVKLKFCVLGTSVPSNTLFSEEGYILLERRKKLNSRKMSQLMFLNVNTF